MSGEADPRPDERPDGGAADSRIPPGAYFPKPDYEGAAARAKLRRGILATAAAAGVTGALALALAARPHVRPPAPAPTAVPVQTAALPPEVIEPLRRVPALEPDREACPRSERDPDDATVLARLTPSARAFYLQSKAVRATYECSHPYKHFILQGYSLATMDAEGYFHHAPAGYGERRAGGFYRLVKDCKTRVTIERVYLDTSAGYTGLGAGDYYRDQCELDGTADTYYVESPTKPE